MKKTMYLAMKNLSNFIANSNSYDFKENWDMWYQEYKPLDDTIPELKILCEKLCNVDKSEISNVPITKYTNTVKQLLKPVIDKEDIKNE